MPELIIDDMQDGYREWVAYVAASGEERAPRGKPTRDVEDLTVVLRDPRKALTEHIGRKASTRLAALEAAQLVAGESWPALMTRVAPNTAQFLSPDGTFHGAYGPRIKDAIPAVIRRLQQDPDSRQCVATIYDSARDLQDNHLVDVPCTVSLLYKITDGRLHAKTVMRSNDVIWGVAHDVFMFTLLQRTMAEFMGLELGHYRHNAYSMHLYEDSWEVVDRMHAPTQPAQIVPPLWHEEWGVSTDPQFTLDEWARGPRTYATRLGANLAPRSEDPWWADMAWSW